MNCRVCELATALRLIIVKSYKIPIYLITPFKITYHVKIYIFILVIHLPKWRAERQFDTVQCAARQ
jgi:hypothetical protein